MPKFIEEYLSVNGIEECTLQFPVNEKPLLIYVHGGPGQSMMPFAGWLNNKIDFATVVYYDQRGTGRTQLRSKSTAETITFEQLLDDLKETIRILKEKYHKSKVILLGHSWGSILATQYALRYPEEVACYIGVGQVIDHRRSEKVGYDHLIESYASQFDEKDREMLKKLGDYPSDCTYDNAYEMITTMRDLQIKYKLAASAADYLKIAFHSSTFRLKDLKAMRQIMQNIHLLEYMLDYSVEEAKDYEVPVFYLLGKDDWQVARVVAEEYFDTINAPKKEIFLIDHAGHIPNVDQPDQFNKVLEKIVSEYQ